MLDAEYFLEKAEQCNRLSRAPGLDETATRELLSMAQEFMAKAVYIDSLQHYGTRGG